jgi:catechol 2,3-dioxygenase-like lactoylglutathione lyase family enzyme
VQTERIQPMVKSFDHVTIVVRDLDKAKTFFALLGFKETKVAIVTGKVMEDYMGVAGIEADHVTLALEDVTPHTEVQLLHYRQPAPLPDPSIDRLNKLGFNHVCFAVDNLDAEIARLQAAGVELRNRVMVFLRGPEDVTVELAEWH